jgi:hypothetical protein
MSPSRCTPPPRQFFRVEAETFGPADEEAEAQRLRDSVSELWQLYR